MRNRVMRVFFMVIAVAAPASAQQFQPPATYARPEGMQGWGSTLVPADLNGDGRLDLVGVVMNRDRWNWPPQSTTYLRVLMNDGSGAFAQSVVTLPNVGAQQLAAGDA